MPQPPSYVFRLCSRAFLKQVSLVKWLHICSLRTPESIHKWLSGFVYKCTMVDMLFTCSVLIEQIKKVTCVNVWKERKRYIREGKNIRKMWFYVENNLKGWRGDKIRELRFHDHTYIWRSSWWSACFVYFPAIDLMTMTAIWRGRLRDQYRLPKWNSSLTNYVHICYTVSNQHIMEDKWLLVYLTTLFQF